MGMAGLLIGLGDAGKAYVAERDSQSKEAFAQKLEQEKTDNEQSYRQQDMQLRQDEFNKKAARTQTIMRNGKMITQTFNSQDVLLHETDADPLAQKAILSSQQEADDKHQEAMGRVGLYGAQTSNTQQESTGKGIANNLATNYGERETRANIAEKVSLANSHTAVSEDVGYSNSSQAADALFQDKGLQSSIQSLVAMKPGQEGIDPVRAREIAKTAYEYAKANGKNARDVFINYLQLEKAKGAKPSGSNVLPQGPN